MMSSSRSGRNPDITEFIYFNKNTGEKVVEKVSEPAYTRRRRLAKEREEAMHADQGEDETVDITVSVHTDAPTVIIVLPKNPPPQTEQNQPQQQNDGFPIVVPIKKRKSE